MQKDASNPGLWDVAPSAQIGAVRQLEDLGQPQRGCLEFGHFRIAKM
jgi:hypothetical protein